MNWILFLLTFEFGLLPGGHFALYEIGRDVYSEFSLDTKFTMEVQLFNKHIFIGGGIVVTFWKVNDNKSFYPDGILSIFNIGFRFPYAEIGYEHRCHHPIHPWMYEMPIRQAEYAYDRIYVRLTIGNGE